MDAVNVGKLSLSSLASFYIRKHIQEKNPTNAANVRNLLPRGHILLYIKEFTRVRNIMDAVSVGKLSPTSSASFYIRKLIERNCEETCKQYPEVVIERK